MSPNTNDPKHWYDRAAEMRVLADTMANAETKRRCSGWRTTTTNLPTEQKSAAAGREIRNNRDEARIYTYTPRSEGAWGVGGETKPPVASSPKT
jgi:hypothetical protein